MIKIGILGDIGSGKSFVAKTFGYPVFDADKEVLKIYKKNKDCFYKLKKNLPKYISSFPIKKKELSKAIRQNNHNLKKIIKIVHPIVRKKLNMFFKKHKKKRIIILDIPLLLENKLFISKNYLLIFVEAKKGQILKRLKKRSNFNLRMYKKLKNAQLPLEIKKKKSNFIIKNNFNPSHLKKNVRILKNQILQNEKYCS